MDEKSLKTSVWQRIVIIVVAALLLGSTVLTYLFIVMSSSSAKQSSAEKIAALEAEYDEKSAAYQARIDALSEENYETLKGYLSQVKSYNATSANDAKLQLNDLKEGTGTQLADGDSNYMAYYIGWCPDGSLLDSSFDYAEDDTDQTTPIKLKEPLLKPTNLIEGWNQGVIGMKLGGVRWISMPGEMAYGDTDEHCGMSNAPLRYVVMALPADEELTQLKEELNDVYYRLYTAYYGS